MRGSQQKSRVVSAYKWPGRCDIDLFRISADCYEEILHYLILLCEQNSITVCCTEAALYLVSAVELLLMSMSIQGAS